MTWTPTAPTHSRAGAVGAPASAVEAVILALTRNRARYVRALRRRLPSDSDADDVFQDLAIRAMARASGLKSPDKAEAWISVLIRNETVNWYRRSAREKRQAEAAAEVAYTTGPADDPPLVQWGCLLAVVGDLPPAQGALIGQIDLGGAAPSQIAAAEGLTRNALNVRLHRARRALTRGLKGACATCPLGDFGRCSADRTGAGTLLADEPRSFAPATPALRRRPI